MVKITEPRIVEVRPYTLTGLARLWQVDRKTIKRWIAPFKEEIERRGPKTGYYYTTAQVSYILACLGLPSRIIIKDKEYDSNEGKK